MFYKIFGLPQVSMKPTEEETFGIRLMMMVPRFLVYYLLALLIPLVLVLPTGASAFWLFYTFFERKTYARRKNYGN